MTALCNTDPTAHHMSACWVPAYAQLCFSGQSLWYLQVNDEASDRVLEVEQEYNKKRRPIYAKRNEYIKQIPGFWKKVLMSHAVLRRVFSEGDLDVLDYLTEVGVFSTSRSLTTMAACTVSSSKCSVVYG